MKSSKAREFQQSSKGVDAAAEIQKIHLLQIDFVRCLFAIDLSKVSVVKTLTEERCKLPNRTPDTISPPALRFPRWNAEG